MLNVKTYLILILAFFSCSSNNSENISTMEQYDFKNPVQFKLTSKLKEISGLTTSNDDNLFAINDEIGIIYKLNAANGKIIKRFFLGKWTAEADFEGLTIKDDQLIAIASNGTIYKFLEGENEQAVEYKIEKLPFSSKFDLEGLFYDKELNGLLIASKEYAGNKNKGFRTVYFYDFETSKINKDPFLKISLKELKKDFGVKDFYPSGISKHPTSGNYYIISARDQNVIIEIEKSGKVISTKKLDEKTHRQPEGITFLKDKTMIISDEGAGKKSTLTKYNYVEKEL